MNSICWQLIIVCQHTRTVEEDPVGILNYKCIFEKTNKKASKLVHSFMIDRDRAESFVSSSGIQMLQSVLKWKVIHNFIKYFDLSGRNMTIWKKTYSSFPSDVCSRFLLAKSCCRGGLLQSSGLQILSWVWRKA